MTDEELKHACMIVERIARSIGPDCEIIFTEDGVQVAPLSWSGCVTEIDLFTALTQAKNDARDIPAATIDVQVVTGKQHA